MGGFWVLNMREGIRDAQAVGVCQHIHRRRSNAEHGRSAGFHATGAQAHTIRFRRLVEI
jgi:hypothetical protein